MGPTLVAGVVAGGIYGLLAVGIVLVYKGSRVLNFAQGELGTFALFVAWWFMERRGQSWAVGALAGVAAALAISLVFERVVVRRMVDASRLAVAVATVGLMFLLIAMAFHLFSQQAVVLPVPISGLGPRILGFNVNPMQIMALVAVVVIAGALTLFLQRTDFGLGVLAAAQDPTMVRLVGVRLSTVSAFTWGMAGAVGAVAAFLVQPGIGAFAPGFMTQFFIRGLAAALVGGLTSLPGAFVGGIVVGVSEAFVDRTFLHVAFPGISSVTVLAIIIAVLLLRPGGIFGRQPA